MAQNTRSTHDRGINTATGGFICDCGHDCADRPAWHDHTLRTSNNPQESHIQARLSSGRQFHSVVGVHPHAAATIKECTKVACYNAGNGRGCWTIAFEGGGYVFEMPSRESAEELITAGGIVSETYRYSHC